MKPEHSITIPVTKYLELISDQYLLSRLRQLGVVKWELYDKALKEHSRQFEEALNFEV